MATTLTDDSSVMIATGMRHLAERDATLAGVIATLEAPRLTRDPRLFRTLVNAIVNQQLSGKVAAAIMRRVEALFPEDAPINPTDLTALGDDALRASGLSWAKVAAVKDLATHVLDGRLELDRLDQLPDEDIIRELVAVRGIGRWTAEMFLIFSLGRPDVLPVDDYGVRKAIQQVYRLEALPNKRELTALAEPWHPYCSVASLMLWRSLDNRPG